MKLAIKLAALSICGFMSIPTLAAANVSDYEINSHSFKSVSFEYDDGQTLNITNSSPPWGYSEYTIDSFMATDGSQALKARYEQVGSGLSLLRLMPQNGGSWDFSDNRMVLAFDVTNTLDCAQRLNTIFRHSAGTTAYVNVINPLTTTTMYCILDQDKIQLGADALPSPILGQNGIVPGPGWGNVNFDKSKVIGIDLGWNVGEVGYFTFDNFRIVENPLYNVEEAYANIIDKYGQLATKEWPNKIYTDEQLKAAQLAEEQQVAQWKAEQESRTDRTIYGGYKNDNLRQEPTGHFYTTKINGIWTLIDPSGYPFFSTGFGIVRKNGMDTWVKGREYMFEELPQRYGGEFSDHYGNASGMQPPHGQKSGTSFSFYSMNLEKKYGSDWLSDWGKMATDRFEAWGMTSIGAWAEPSLFFGKGSTHKTPYTAFTWTTVGSGKHVRLYDTIPDAYDPEFRTSTVAAITDQAVKFGIHNDPYCFGVYVDNEYPWGTNMTSNNLIKAIMDDDSSNPKSYAKRHFVTVLEQKYGNISALNSAWGCNLSSFTQLGQPYTGKVAEEDASLIISQLSDQYYSVVDSVVNELLPGTMYLGSRNTEWGTPIEVIKSAIKYVDILSFNNYNPDVQREKFKLEEYDMPMIIGEFCFSATDRGHFSPTTMAVSTQQDRADSYINYVESALKSGKFVGVHWFQYYDEPILGRSWDGENFNLGFVDVTDQPYMELVEASRYLYDTMYETMFNHVPMTNIQNEQSQIYLNKGESESIRTATTPIGLNADVSYFSTNLYVAEVDEYGLVTAISDGEATIITKNANDLFVVTSTNVTVGNGDKLASVKFDSDSKEMNLSVGATLDLKNYVQMDSTYLANLEWKSSQKAIATVANGLVTAHSPGRVNIIVSDKNGFTTDSLNLVIGY